MRLDASSPLLVLLLTVSAVPAAAQPGQSPTGLVGTAARNAVTLTWQAPATPAAAVERYLLEVGFQPGTTATTFPLGTATSLSTNAPDGVFFVRVRAVTGAGLSGASNEVRLVTGQAGPPDPPLALQAASLGLTMGVQWTENPSGPSVTGYLLEAGSGPGQSDLARLSLPPNPSAITGQVQPGTYFLRLRAFNAAGLSAPSNEAVATAPSACPVPAAPVGVVATPTPGAVALSWSQPAGAPVTGYRLDVGSVSGASNIGSFALQAATSVQTPAPAGNYFIRVRATNVCGASPPSPQVAFTVPAPPLPSMIGTWDGVVSGHPGSFGRGPITSFVLLISRQPTRNNIAPGGQWADNLGCRSNLVVPFLTSNNVPVISIESLACNDGDFTLTVTGAAGNLAQGTCRGGCTFVMRKR